MLKPWSPESYEPTDASRMDSCCQQIQRMRSLLKIVGRLKTTPSQVRLAVDMNHVVQNGTPKQIAQLCREVSTAEKAAEYFDLPEHVFRKKRMPDTEDSKTLRDAASARRATRRANDLRWRLCEEMTTHPEWFWIMDTLTSKDEEDITDPIHWNRYRALIRKHVGHTPAHVAVIEHGTNATKRPHIHVIWGFETIPDWWKNDPCRWPGDKRRELTILKRYWKKGWSTPIPIRFGPHDAWGKAGFLWPGGQKPALPIQMASYLAKYVSKQAYRTPDEETRPKWRNRISRNLGLERMQKAMDDQPEHHLSVVEKLPLLNRLLLEGHKVMPSTLLLRRVSLGVAAKNFTADSRAAFQQRQRRVPPPSSARSTMTIPRSKLESSGKSKHRDVSRHDFKSDITKAVAKWETPMILYRRTPSGDGVLKENNEC